MNAIFKNKSVGAAIAALFLLICGSTVIAQIEGPKRGIAPIASTGDFEVRDIEVNTTGETAIEARQNGWEEAQRKGWTMLWARTHGGAQSSLADSSLDGIVSAIEVQSEEIGPHRYIAKLGILFDRARAGQLLGVQGIATRSAPLLVLPITYSGGSATVFEQQTMWQRAWATFRTADSRIDYVRPSGSGSESLLLNAGQLSRRSRQWWRVILDQFGAADVITPIARLERQWPGGPIVGKFAARYGPDNKFLGSFTLRAENSAGLNAMLEQAVKKMDELFQNALATGRLRADVSLVLEPEVVAEENLTPVEAPVATTTIDPLEQAVKDITGTSDPNAPTGADGPKPDAKPEAVTVTLSIPFSSPTADDVGRCESVARSVAGVTSASTTSLAIGGTSVMRVVVQGDAGAVRSAMASRGCR